jgi:hypothetical protein
MQTFLCNVPFSGKVNEIKKKLNITSVNIVPSPMKGKNKNMQEIEAPSNKPNTIWFTFIISPDPYAHSLLVNL